MTVSNAQHHDHDHHHDSTAAETDAPRAPFEPEDWDERYAGDEQMWSGNANAQLVAEASKLTPGTAVDIGSGEGGDVIWLANNGWHATGADFSAQGLAKAARHAAEAGVTDRTDWWQVDARTFEPDERRFDLVTSHFLHPADGGMVEVTARLAAAVAPGGHLLLVGHAPMEHFAQMSEEHRRAMWVAADLVTALPDDFDVLVVEQRPRSMERNGEQFDVHDSTLLARRRS